MNKIAHIFKSKSNQLSERTTPSKQYSKSPQMALRGLRSKKSYKKHKVCYSIGSTLMKTVETERIKNLLKLQKVFNTKSKKRFRLFSGTQDRRLVQSHKFIPTKQF